MNWFWRLFARILRLDWVEQLAARAQLMVELIVADYERYPPGSLSPQREHALACFADEFTAKAHILIEAYIFHRAMQLAGVRHENPRGFVSPRRPWRPLSRPDALRRLRDLRRRLDTMEEKARERAQLYRSRRMDACTTTPSTRIPRAGGGPVSRASANLLCRLLRVLRTRTGRPPARATRWRGLAIRDGPALAA